MGKGSGANSSLALLPNPKKDVGEYLRRRAGPKALFYKMQ